MLTSLSASSAARYVVSGLLTLGALALGTGCVVDSAESAGDLEGFELDAPATEAQDMGVRSDPEELCVVTGSHSEAGTSATVTLTWIDDFETWRCSITPTTKSKTYCCNPTYQGYSGATGYFGINNPSEDGLQIDEAYSIRNDGSLGFEADLFTDVGGTYCTGYDWSNLAYKRCWVDDDGHGNCGHMKIGSNDSTLNMYSAHSFSCQ